MFKVGDRVRANSDIYGVWETKGLLGTVIAIEDSDYITPYGVVFDTDVQGHSLENRCKDGRGLWCDENELELIEEDKEGLKVNDVIKFAKLRDDVKIPNKLDENAGYDIYANFEEDYILIEPHSTVLIPTGLISAFNSDYVAVLKERGSTGSKGIGQRCGIIDAGFRGEWFIPLSNHNSYSIAIVKSDKINNVSLPEDCFIYPYGKAICQMLLLPVPKFTVEECTVEEIKNIKSIRGEGMLGSSGK